MIADKKNTKKQQKKKLIITIFALGAAGVLGYFGWQYWKKKKGSTGKTDSNEISTSDKNSSAEILKPFTSSSTAINNNSSFSPKPKKKTASKDQVDDNSGFPLRKGSKGEKVRQLQEALIAKHGKSILPRYGADGDFGSEVIAALKKLGLPSSIDGSTFNVLVQGTSSANSTSSSVGKDLWLAASAKDFIKAMGILKKMKSTEDYSSANNVFKQYRLQGGVRQTIVNGLLDVFTSTEQKEKIKYEFLRMGLQFDGKKWSLSGLDGLPIMTVVPATIWINAYKGVEVPARMVLGKEVCRRLDYTLFQNKGKYFLVNTNCVKHL